MENNFKYAVMDYMAGKLSCKQVSEAVTDYLEGALTFFDRLRFQMHLGMCFACRNYLRQMKQTIRTLGKLPAEPIPSKVRDELLERFKDWKKKTS